MKKVECPRCGYEQYVGSWELRVVCESCKNIIIIKDESYEDSDEDHRCEVDSQCECT